MHKLLLCHRRDGRLDRMKLHSRMRGRRRQLVLDLNQPLGFQRYAQVLQVGRLNPVYQFARLSRSRMVATLFAAILGKQLPSLPEAHHQKRPWDVVEEFWYPNLESLKASLMSAKGIRAIRQLRSDQSTWSTYSVAVVAEEFVVVPGKLPPPRMATFFFLRTHPTMTRESMLDYWGTSHAQLVTSLQPSLGYGEYEQMHVSSDVATGAIADALREEFDGVASLAYGTIMDMVWGLLNPFTQIANIKLIGDEVGFIDAQRSVLMLGNRFFD